jgi:Rrf2 family protein
MKLSTRGRYGIRALLDLAFHSGEGTVVLKDIARRQEISLPYLDHLITPLVAAGLVKSTRGARGGILLLKPPAEIKLSEVVQLLEGSVALVDCVNNPALCHRSAFCVTRDIWVEMKEAMSQVLDSTTLQDLVERQRKKEATNQGSQPLHPGGSRSP